MFRKKFFILITLCFFVIGLSSWGFLVHRTINQLAIYSLPAPLQSYFYLDQAYLVSNAPRPDLRRKKDKLEAAKHFIDLEVYGPNAVNNMPKDWAVAVKKYSVDTLLKHGWAPYLIIKELDKLTNAFRSKNKDSILFYAADIGHYIGDIQVPLHTTINYDGQQTNQKGLHSLWESFIPTLRINQYQLFHPHKATYLKNPKEVLWEDIRKANSLIPALLAVEKEVSIQFKPENKYKTKLRNGKIIKTYSKAFAEAYANGLGSTINTQLIASANRIADFWYTAWVNAGKPNLATREISPNLSAELKSYQLNRLIQDHFLLSKQGKQGHPEN